MRLGERVHMMRFIAKQNSDASQETQARPSDVHLAPAAVCALKSNENSANEKPETRKGTQP